LGLMPGGGTATVGGRRYGARMMLDLSDGIGDDGGAEAKLLLTYEF